MALNRRSFLLAVGTIPLYSAYAKKGFVNVGRVSPEDFGAKGDGVSDDSEALSACFSSKKPILLKDGSVYIWKSKCSISHPIDVSAIGSEIKSDGNFLEVIDGAGSNWYGGTISSISEPYSVEYDSKWNISKSGDLKAGRIPFLDDKNTPSEFKTQRIGAALVFRSSNQMPVSGLKIKKLKVYNGNIIVAGFKNTNFTDCIIKGGAHTGCISIINGTREPLLWGYDNLNGLSEFKYSRGNNHNFENCILSDCKYNGLYVSGSSDIQVKNCTFSNNGESGFKTAQYVKRSWLDSDCCCQNITLENCTANGQYYDGFDVQNAFGSGQSLILESDIKVIGCISRNNRRAGFVSQGGGNKFINCTSHDNGVFGLISMRSDNILISKCNVYNNCNVFSGAELKVSGNELTVTENTISHNPNSIPCKLFEINLVATSKDDSVLSGIFSGNHYDSHGEFFLDKRIKV